MLVIKIQNGEDVRRVTVEKALKYEELKELARSLFRGDLPKPFMFRYKDDEGDLISITGDRELEEAFRLFKDQGIYRFTVIPKKVKPKVEQKETPQFKSPFDLNELMKVVSPYVDAVEVHLDNVTPFINETLGSIFAPENKDSSSPSPFFGSAICDHCNTKISGIRWKCNSCMDYDLCDPCKQLNTVHTDHEFTRLVSKSFQPLRIPVRKEKPTEEQKGVKPAEDKKEEKVEKKEEVRPVEEKKEEAKPVEEVKVEKKEEVKPVEEKKEVKPVETERELTPLEMKLNQLEEMGFNDKKKNLELLVKYKLDIVRVIRDLLN